MYTNSHKKFQHEDLALTVSALGNLFLWFHISVMYLFLVFKQIMIFR